MERTNLTQRPKDAAEQLIKSINASRTENAGNPAGVKDLGATGAVVFTTPSGSKTVISANSSPTGVAPWVGDTTAPGKPTGLSAISHNGTVLIRWDGTLDGGVPADFDHIECMASYGGHSLDVGSLRVAGELPTGVIAGGTVVTLTAVAYDDAHAENGAPSPNVSPVSDSVSVTVESSVDPATVDELSDKLATAQQTLDQAQTDIDSAQQTASDAATQAATAVASASAASQQADAALTTGVEWVTDPTFTTGTDRLAGDFQLNAPDAPTPLPSPATTCGAPQVRDTYGSVWRNLRAGQVLDISGDVVASTAVDPDGWLQLGVHVVTPAGYEDWLFGVTQFMDNVPSEWAHISGQITIPHDCRAQIWIGVDVAGSAPATDLGWRITNLSIRDGTASQALTVANLAQAAAQGLVSASIAAPTSPPSGAIWFPLDANGRVIGMKLWNGTAWTSYTIMADQMLVPGSVGTVSIADGVVTAPKLSAGVLDVGNLTSTGTSTLAEAVAQAVWAGIVNAQVANIQDLHATNGSIDSAVIGKLAAQIITSSQFWTSLTGARIGMDAQGLHAYNSGGDKTFDLTGDTGLIRGAAIEGGSVSMIGDGSTATTTIYSDDFTTVTKTPYKDSSGHTAVSSVTGSGILYSDNYNGWSVNASNFGGGTATLTVSTSASGRTGSALQFTVSNLTSSGSYSSAIWLNWNYGMASPYVISSDGIRTLSFWIKPSQALTIAGQTFPAGTWTQLTRTYNDGVGISLLALPMQSPIDGATTILIDDFTITQQTNTASSAVIDKDSSGRAQITLWDAQGNRTVHLNGSDNRIMGELVAGTAHLTGWKSDDGTNTRSGFVFDDAAGAVASDSAADIKPRLIANKDATGKVDTLISTGLDSSGNQALVQASQSMNKASMVNSTNGYTSEVAVASPISFARGTSAQGSSGLQWGNGYIDLLGVMGNGLAGEALKYGLVYVGNIPGNGTVTITVSPEASAARYKWKPFATPLNWNNQVRLVYKLIAADQSKFTIILENISSAYATGCGIVWLAIRGDGTND